jgi:hypothetical protein
VIFAVMVVFCCATVLPDSSTVSGSSTAISSPVSAPARKSQPALPEVPAAKTLSPANSDAEDTVPASSESITPRSQPFSNTPSKPAVQETYESVRQREIWYGLLAASSVAAFFDAWTTRRAVEGGYGVEGNPLLRPFAHSSAIYAATQASPVVMDYLGHRMMTSHHQWMRRFWWVPQVTGTSVSLAAGVHNYRMVP